VSATDVDRPGAGSTTRHVGRYRLLNPLGVGASSTVHRAVDTDTGAEVAVKVLADNHSLVPELRARFADEVALLSAIDHPSVAKIHDWGETETGQPYLVLELADRGDLGRRVAERRSAGVVAANGNVPGDVLGDVLADVLMVAAQLAGALGSLHDSGIVHRDVSPANLLIKDSAGRPGLDRGGRAGPDRLLAPGERILLADLGLAKDLRFASGLTAGAGTRGFAAPEQLDPVTVVDERADVYGATAVVAWLLQPDSDQDDRLDIGCDPTAFSPALARFLARGMAGDPARRHGSMGEWVADLQRCLTSADPSGRHSRPRTGSTRPGSTRPGSPRPALVKPGLAALAVSAVLAAGAAVVVGLGGEPPSSQSVGSAASPTDTPQTSTSTSTPTSTSPANSAPISTATTAPTSTVAPTSTSTSTAPPTSTASSPPTSTATSAPTSTATSTLTSTTETSTTATSTSTSGSTSTSVDPRFARSPRATIAQPASGAALSGDLVLSGDARYHNGIVGVAVVIRRDEDRTYWHDSTQSFEDDWVRFVVPVSDSGGTDVGWSYRIEADSLPPGDYFARVWAVGTGANDPISDQVTFTVLR
jgi:serine/threonine protein kinase